MKRNGRITFDSYDRFFPNQDKVPKADSAISLRYHCRKSQESRKQRFCR